MLKRWRAVVANAESDLLCREAIPLFFFSILSFAFFSLLPPRSPSRSDSNVTRACLTVRPLISVPRNGVRHCLGAGRVEGKKGLRLHRVFELICQKCQCQTSASESCPSLYEAMSKKK